MKKKDLAIIYYTLVWVSSFFGILVPVIIFTVNTLKKYLYLNGILGALGAYKALITFSHMDFFFGVLMFSLGLFNFSVMSILFICDLLKKIKNKK